MAKLSRCRQTLEKIQPGCTLPRRRKRAIKLSTYFADITIDDGDLRSKLVFLQLMNLFATADTTPRENQPVVTIPAR